MAWLGQTAAGKPMCLFCVYVIYCYPALYQHGKVLTGHQNTQEILCWLVGDTLPLFLFVDLIVIFLSTDGQVYAYNDLYKYNEGIFEPDATSL